MPGAKWYRIVAERDPSTMIVSNGEAREGMTISVPDEVVEQIRAGYQCINCFEPLSESFPEACPVCGFPMKAAQAEQFAKVYVGHKPGLRTGADWEAEADRIQAQAERREFERRAEKQGISVPRIVVPRDLP